MQIDWFTFVAQIVNFLILIVLLQRFLYKPVIKAMDERERNVASELEDARLKKVEADKRERELDKKLKDFESEKARLLDDARQEVDDRRQEWMDQLRSEITDIRKRWIEALENEKESFLDNLKEETSEQVIALIERVLSDLSERNLQQQTVDFFVQKFSQLDEEDTKQLRKTIKQLDTSQAEIISSFELKGEQKHKLTDLIHQQSGVQLECEFVTSDSLGFGLEVHVGGWQLGWNLQSYLEKLRRDMDRILTKEIPVRQTSDIK